MEVVLFDEIAQRFDLAANIYVVVLDHSSPYVGGVAGVGGASTK